ncbi:hypothetical protein [Bacillus sp. FJAT-29937]|uniref:hypothetical protein n=1 Tax=Bacillus sp. FJAT-29937 TaxID=1720553 RepID=UPI00082A5FE6|nr:hypothetical protein [Bacillus sp. FJAT-29937]
MAKALTLRQEKIKQREGDQLKRSLRSLFGGLDFGFLWVDDHTSYTDGETIFIKYDIQTPQHRDFSPEECRILRKSHGLHERGHIEYDVIEDYITWQEERGSGELADWKDFLKQKYPARWLQFFGNMSMDGRMENFVALKLPSYKEYIDFCNYEWRFGIRGEGIGENPVNDFQDCYSSRVLGMTDLESWLPESLALVESIQDKIDELRLAPSTRECLEIVSDIMVEVWPTLVEWMDLNEMDMDEPPSPQHADDHEHTKQWGDSRETSENAQKILIKVRAAEEEESSEAEKEGHEDNEEAETSTKPDFTHIISIEAKQLKKEEKAIEAEIQDFAERVDMVEIEIPDKVDNNKEDIHVKPYRNQSVSRYQSTYTEVKRYIKPIAKALKDLLKEEKESVRKNVRSGRIMSNRVWKAVHCDDTNIFSKKQTGTPKGSAFVSFLSDISGSTYSTLPNGVSVIEEIKKSMLLLLESCMEANVPSTAYAFTEYDGDTIIYPIKPNPNRYGDEEKGYLGAITPEYGNRDPLALQWSINQLAKQDEDIRLLIILSDGLPIFSHEEGPETIRHMVEKAEKNGIDVLCLFVGEPEKRVLDLVKLMYPGRAIFANKDIARELQKHIKRIIRQRRN